MDNGKNTDAMRTQKEIIAVERGKRLRICRDYTGLNIKEFCQKYGFNTITFGRWEKGNKVSLNEKNVDKVSHALLREGIICTRAWLLEGIGTPPTEKESSHLRKKEGGGKSSKSLAAMMAFSEMEIFEDNHENAITTIINDTAMEPFYGAGDHVGGIKLASSEYDLAHKKDCLVRILGTNKILLRGVQFSGQKIILTATNPTPSYSEPIILDNPAKLELLAPVVFLRKDAKWIRRKV